MFHVFALTYYILLHCVTRRDVRVQYDVITRAVHETCFCCRSCNGRFCSHLHLLQFAALCDVRVQYDVLEQSPYNEMNAQKHLKGSPFFFRLSILSSRKTSCMFFNLHSKMTFLDF